MRDVAFSCDDRGADFLRVTVASLLANYRGEEPLRINVLEGFGGHSPGNKAALRAVVDRWNRGSSVSAASSSPSVASPRFSLRYIDVEPAIRPHAELIMNRERSRWNVFTWAPIFVPAVLPDAVGNVVHLDIDMLLNADISPLFELDLGDDLIAAVAEYDAGDAFVSDAIWGRGILPAEAERYFNTGTLVFNVGRCREERTWERILEWYREHYDVADRIEQDAWNALYWRRTRLLPLKWNFHDRLVKKFVKLDPRDRYWSGNPPRECVEAALRPAILHFWGPKKPWKTCHRPYRRLYHAVMRSVGMKPPREPLLAFWHDFVAGRCFARLRRLARREWGDSGAR